MQFGSFMEFHSREGVSQAEAFEESLAHVDMAEQLGLDAGLYGDIIRANRSGIRSAECSWILETNTPMINTLERAGARRWRTYRIYDKPLTP